MSDGTVDPIDPPALPVPGRQVTPTDVERMVDRLLLSGPDAGRKRSAFWALLLLSAAIASAGVMMDSTATVIGAMIVAPLMVPILGTALALVLSQRTAMLASLGTVLGGALAVIAVGYLFGLLDPLGVSATANTQIDGRIELRLIDLVAALATGTVGAFALARSDVSDALPGVAIAISRPAPRRGRCPPRGGALRGRPRRDVVVRDQRDGHRGHWHGRVPGLPRPRRSRGHRRFGRSPPGLHARRGGRAGRGRGDAARRRFDDADPRPAAPTRGDADRDPVGRGPGVAGRPSPSDGRALEIVALGPPPEVDPEQLRREFDAAGLADVDLRIDLVVGGTRELPGTGPG